MIQHIKNSLLLLLLTFTITHAENNKFIFDKSIIVKGSYSNLHEIYTYTPNEANNLFKNKVINIDFNTCKTTNLIFSQIDSENYNMLHNLYPDISHNFYSNYILKNLKFKITNQKICTIDNKDYYLVNNSYLIYLLDEYFFIFKKNNY